MAAMGWDPSSFAQAQRGVRARRVSVDAEIGSNDRISCSADVRYTSARGGTFFLLNPLLKLEETVLDGQRVSLTRSGPAVRLPDQSGDHQLQMRFAGSLPSDGGLGVSGSSFDLNGNVLWVPTFAWGTRLEVEVKVAVPPGAEVLFPSNTHEPDSTVPISSSIDVTIVGGKVRFRSHGGGTAVESLVRDGARDLQGSVEQVMAWQERNWGPAPFGTLSLVETWRRTAGAYARPGLVVTPDWTGLPEQELSQRIVHETAHQWWGMDVLPGEEWFSEDWLSEGLATYCEFLWLREKAGPGAAGGFLKTAAAAVEGLQGSLSATSPFSKEGWSLSRYGGSLALLELEHRIPDLVGKLRTFRDRHRGTFVTTKALVRALSSDVPETWLTEHLLAPRAWPGDLRPSPR